MTGSIMEERTASAEQPERQRGFVAFVLAAGASVPVNLLARVMLSQWLPYGWAVLLSHGIGMLTAYVLTRTFVFQRSGRPVHSELGRFALVNVGSAALTWAVSVSLVEAVFPRLHFDRQPELVAHVIGLAVASLSSFVGHSRYSFGRR